MPAPGYNVDLIIEDIHQDLERDQAAKENFEWAVLLNPSPAFRRMLLLAWGITFAQQAVGIDGIQYYLVDVLEEAGIKSLEKQSMYLIGMAIIKLQCIVLCALIVDLKGRRFVFFVSLAGKGLMHL